MALVLRTLMKYAADSNDDYVMDVHFNVQLVEENILLGQKYFRDITGKFVELRNLSVVIRSS